MARINIIESCRECGINYKGYCQKLKRSIEYNGDGGKIPDTCPLDTPEEKLMKFAEHFMGHSEQGYGAKLFSNETGFIVSKKESVIGQLLLPWNKTF
jgi:hypothetical protein